MKVLLDENLAHRLRQVTQSLTLGNPCARFIHSFIVDEWETMNLNSPRTPAFEIEMWAKPAHHDKTVMNGAQLYMNH